MYNNSSIISYITEEERKIIDCDSFFHLLEMKNTMSGKQADEEFVSELLSFQSI